MNDTHFAVLICVLKYYALQYINTSQYHPIPNKQAVLACEWATFYNCVIMYCCEFY